MKGVSKELEINHLEYQLELYEYLSHLIRRLENLVRVYEEAVHRNSLRGGMTNSRDDLSLIIDYLGSLLTPTLRHVNGPRFQRIRLLDNDPPCLIDGKFQDKLICDECREKYPLLASLLEGFEKK